MKRFLVGLVTLGLVTAAVVGVFLVRPGQVKASPDYAGFHAYVDRAQGAYFAFTFDSMTNPAGTAAYGVSGVGLVEIAQPSISLTDQDKIIVTYQGSAELETDAVLNLDIGLARPGTTRQPVTAQLSATIDPAAETAIIDFAIGGNHYTLDASRPAQSPDGLVSNLTTALAARNWGGLYDLTAPMFQQGVDRSSFISQSPGLWAAQFGTGPLTVTVAGEPTLIASWTGNWMATTQLTINSSEARATYNLTLQWVGDHWAIFDMSQPTLPAGGSPSASAS